MSHINEILRDEISRSDRSSRWPYDSKYSLVSRSDEFLPPYLQDEVQYRPSLAGDSKSTMEINKSLPMLNPDDDQLKLQILNYLEFTSKEVAEEIEVRVEEGEVYFDGKVQDHWMKLQIEGLAEQIPGVKKVINNILVDPLAYRSL